MLRTAEVGLFDWPVSCPNPPTGVNPDKGYVEDWISETRPNLPQRTSYGTYAGLFAILAGAAITAIAFLRKSKSTLLQWAGIILACVGAVTAAAGKFCGVEFNVIDRVHDRVLYSPPRDISATPEDLGVPHEAVSISTPDGETLDGFYLKAPVETKKTLIYLHGRANNIGSRLKEVAEMQKKLPLNVLMVDYRGFGKSTLKAGRITQDGLVTDAEAMYDYLITKKNLSPENICLYGHSLGGAAAAQLAKKKEMYALIVDASFTSLKDVAGEYFFSIVPKSWLGKATKKDEFDSIDAIKNTKAKKVCIIHGTRDDIVPVGHAAKLFAVIDKPEVDKELILLDGANHSDCYEHLQDEHINILRRFMGIDTEAA